ncbi:hypothetical protein KR054_010200 [Drosophila jambulina]|nr:hypothetical protein KR054_010200 [Drosophila jambulina]
MICRLCLNALDEQNAVLLFGGAGAGSAPTEPDDGDVASGKMMPESSYLVQLISIHLYLCLSRDDAISTCICTECCSQLESFHNFWKLVELKQTTLCSQFLEIDCDVNWSEDGGGDDPAHHLLLEPEFPEIWVKSEPKATTVTPSTTAVNKFPCMFCEKSFKMRRYLEEHIATHTGDRPIACPYCEMAFRCRSNMYTHVKSKHTTQWLKAREERDAARSHNQGALLAGEAKVDEVVLAPVPAAVSAAAAPQLSPPIIHQTAPPLPLSVIKSEPSEAINLTISKALPSAAGSRVTRTRSSRRKTHSPKKVQHTEGSDASDEDHQLPQKRLKENELILANYNAVAAAVVAAAAASSVQPLQPDSLQQRLCASLLQQQQQQQDQQDQQDQLFAVMSATAAAVSSQGVASTTTTTTTTTGAMPSNPYSSPPADAERQTLDKRRVNPPPIQAAAAPAPVSLMCPNCGELPGQNHRCLSKPKYACDVCGKCFKMKRYLEEHFATHTGVKLHTCAFCPTEFRSKSNMYHHTKRKHKAEWERSRATRSAAKAGVQEQQQEQQEQQEQQQQEQQLV